MTLPLGITRSLGPTKLDFFQTLDSIPARIVILTVWQVFVLTLKIGSLSNWTCLMRTFATFSKATAPVKLTRSHSPKASVHRFSVSSFSFVSGLHFQGGISLLPPRFPSLAPTYSTQKDKNTQCNPSVKVYGVFSSTSQLTVSSLLFQFH